MTGVSVCRKYGLNGIVIMIAIISCHQIRKVQLSPPPPPLVLLKTAGLHLKQVASAALCVLKKMALI